jgi:PRTRC genetic system ThiF family protein
MNVNPYLLNPTHPVTISVIGCGGTGSNVLQNLAALNLSLKALDHPGIHIYAFDFDKVSQANVARQMFYQSDIGKNKAEVLVSRINASYGFDWSGIPFGYEAPISYSKNGNKEIPLTSNITIGCVDTIASRKTIWKILQEGKKNSEIEFRTPYYWLDCGNGKNFGQVILGSVDKKLPNVLDTLPRNAKDKKKDLEPSCSLAEALSKQDLYINKLIATFCCDIIWKMFRRGVLESRGIYFNSDPLTINQIKI